MELPSDRNKVPKIEGEESQALPGDPNAEYITISRLSDDIVQLVRGSGGQVNTNYQNLQISLRIGK